MPQLMSELVRKAEADIDALRGRLSMVGSAGRGEGAAPSSSAALLQVRALPPPCPSPSTPRDPDRQWPAPLRGGPATTSSEAPCSSLLCFMPQWCASAALLPAGVSRAISGRALDFSMVWYLSGKACSQACMTSTRRPRPPISTGQ